MVYVIMCGGKYPHFERHKALTMINGEPLIARTIRMLKEMTDDQIFITADDEAFSEYGVVLPHKNSYRHDGIQGSGYWLDAFYPHFLDGMEVTFLMGDVCFTEEALKTIVEYKAEKNTLFGTSIANNSLHFDWGEAFAYKGEAELPEHHLYVCPEDSPELRKHTAFRDYLRTNPDAAREYSRIKEKGADLYPDDIEKYIQYKSSNIQKVYAELELS